MAARLIPMIIVITLVGVVASERPRVSGGDARSGPGHWSLAPPPRSLVPEDLGTRPRLDRRGIGAVIGLLCRATRPVVLHARLGLATGFALPIRH